MSRNLLLAAVQPPAPGGEVDHQRTVATTLELLDRAGRRVGVMTCYDGHFPEVGRLLALDGASRSAPSGAKPATPANSSARTAGPRPTAG